MTDLCRQLEREQIPYRENCPLAPLCSFRIGGTAAVAVFPKTGEQLVRALCLACEYGDYEIIGNGSNVLFPDGLYRGSVIFTGGCRTVSCQERELTVCCGAPLSTVARCAGEHSLAGMEFAAGIPGTVGGAVLMNAGAFGGCMAQVTRYSLWWDRETGKLGRMEGAEQRFGERTSIYAEQPRYAVLGAGLLLHEGTREEIDARMEEYRVRRRATQPLQYPNAGSIFKRPQGHFAGKLIEDCGLKGFSVGGAEVSEKHAGFIVNRGGATARDVRELISVIRERVFRETGVMLECELRLIGNQTL